MRNAGERRLQNAITIFCALVFAIFSFTFVAIYKSGEIEVVYDTMATGKLQYNGYLISAVLTSLLTGLALWLNRFANFRREWTAMAYIPSSLFLAFLTDIDRSFFIGGKDFFAWLPVFVVGILLYSGFSFVLNRMLFEKIKDTSMVANRIIWRNLILFVIIFMTVGCLASGDKNFRREALQYTCYKSGNIDDALAVGRYSPTASRQMSAQRAYLLSLKGELAERFFNYPVCYAAESLLPAVEQDAPISPDIIYAHIGVERNEGESTIDCLARAAGASDTAAVAREYYLTALLADRRLVDFVDKLYEFHGAGDALPKHYKEALVLYAYIVPSFDAAVNDPQMLQKFNEMAAVARECSNAENLSHILRLSYGDTYWWYFLYGE